jgi:hypothetical protein
MKTSKLFTISLIGLFLLGMTQLMSNSLAAGNPNAPSNVTGHHQNGKLGANQTHQYKFKNNFQFQFQSNSSVDMNLSCDTESLGANEFDMKFNGSSNIGMQIKCNSSSSSLGLNNGTQVRVRNRHGYQNKNQLTLNVSHNSTGPIQAQLMVKTAEKNATWAYYNGTTKEWIPVASQLQNGELTANTNHFSVWTVLVGETATEPDTESSIDGYSLFIIPLLMGIGILFKKRK